MVNRLCWLAPNPEPAWANICDYAPVKRITVSLPDNVAFALQREARRRGVPVSALARGAIEARLELSPGDRRKLPFAALGRSGHRWTAKTWSRSSQLGGPLIAVVESSGSAVRPGYATAARARLGSAPPSRRSSITMNVLPSRQEVPVAANPAFWKARWARPFHSSVCR